MPEQQTFEIRIRADKSGEPNPDGSWPFSHLEVSAPVDQFRLSARLAARGLREGWIALDNARVVERPAKPEPDEVDGSCAPSVEHWLAEGTREDPLPHRFVQADAIILRTASHGDLRYRVVHQPDKYVADGSDEDKVSAEAYANGQTRVDHFYDLVLEA